MPKLTKAVPRLSKRTVNGKIYAVVWLGGKPRYCGRWGTREARAKYDNIIGEWLHRGRPSRLPDAGEINVNQLCAAFWRHAKQEYAGATLNHFRLAVRVLRRRYGKTAVAAFGPIALKILRRSFIKDGACRTYANQRTQRIRQIFKWGVSEELVPPDVLLKLQAVEGLRKGRGAAKERPPVEPVSLEDFEATLPYLPAVVADLLRVQLYTGARPSEICAMSPGRLDTSKDPWEYRPVSHKTAQLGKGRVIFIGPKAQDALRPYLIRPDDQHCFRPVDSETKRRRALNDARKTPLSCGNKPGSNRRRRPAHQPGEAYQKDALNRAVRRAVDKLNEERKCNGLEPIPRWTPYQLRHAWGTRVRKDFGLEHAQCVLGHSQAKVTEIYAARDQEKAREAIRRIG